MVSGAMASHVKAEVIASDNVYSSFLDTSMVLFDAYSSSGSRIVFVSPAFYRAVNLDARFTKSGDKALEFVINGSVGMVDKAAIVVAPTEYFPESVNSIITHLSVMASLIKIASL